MGELLGLGTIPQVQCLMSILLSPNCNIRVLFPHSNAECRRLASASKDGTIRLWDVVLQRILFILSGHTQSVSCVKWGGVGLLYSASHDRTIKVWRSDNVFSPNCLVPMLLFTCLLPRESCAEHWKVTPTG